MAYLIDILTPKKSDCGEGFDKIIVHKLLLLHPLLSIASEIYLFILNFLINTYVDGGKKKNYQTKL